MTDASKQDGATATIEQTQSQRPKTRQLPPWKVLLHNDDVNDVIYVVDTIMELTPLHRPEAMIRMVEAHRSGVAHILSTHREHAELLQEQFESKCLTVTIEAE